MVFTVLPQLQGRLLEVLQNVLHMMKACNLGALQVLGDVVLAGSSFTAVG
jgi:hypothetical protein